MKIVDYETFIRMPSGTIFAPYKPNVLLDHPEIKVDHGSEYTDADGKTRWSFNGTCVLMPHPTEYSWDDDHCETEFFYYDGDSNDAKSFEQFLIYEKEDIENLMKVLKWAMEGCDFDSPLITGIPGLGD